jgi:hypothetical protein
MAHAVWRPSDERIAFPRKIPPRGWGCGGLLGFTALLLGGTICLNVGFGEVHMSPPRESQGSTKIARQAPIERVSQRTRNSAIPHRASKNSREFDAQSFLATIGEGRKAFSETDAMSELSRGSRRWRGIGSFMCWMTCGVTFSSRNTLTNSATS